MPDHEQAVGFPVSSLNGDAAATDTYSIAQHNLGVLLASQIRPHFYYPFQIWNDTDEARSFVVAARQAPLHEIAAFLPGVPGGRKLLDRPGKVEHLGIAAATHPNPAELAAAPAVLPSLKMAPRSCRAFTLAGSLKDGNALIHVTQAIDKRIVGGPSVLLLSEHG